MHFVWNTVVVVVYIFGCLHLLMLILITRMIVCFHYQHNNFSFVVMFRLNEHARNVNIGKDRWIPRIYLDFPTPLSPIMRIFRVVKTSVSPILSLIQIFLSISSLI